ncbi:hypothetical protein [Serratia sp. M24T3]|uniref:hypothetical protein n=1 Tax=Serratia sp. M24T3 TaxID=932213 RepID=UPI00055F7DDC|nr:hypothetical protein [Serratia sp. M24T3]
MRITVNAPDKECAGVAMSCAQDFIAKKKDDDGTSDGWGYLPKGFNVYVVKKKNGNISATCHRAPIKIQEAA